MQYFENLLDEKDIKKRYRDLARMHHPDHGGSSEIMKEINSEYEKILSGAYQRAGKSLTEIEELLENDFAVAEAINSLLSIEDIIISLMGKWVWITGNTKPCKELLKQAKFRWSNDKKAWYWRPPEYFRRFNRKRFNLSEIAYMHGDTQIKSPIQRKKYTPIQ